MIRPPPKEPPTSDNRRHHVLPQLLATTIVSWLSIVVGYASAYSSPAESTMVLDLNITKSESSWVCSLLPVGALVGSLSGGPFVDLLGRKATLILTDVVFLVAWSLSYYAGGLWSMYLSRVLNGYGVGITSFALPVYLAETLRPAIRGRLGLFPTAFGNLGILICFVCGNVLDWRQLSAVGVFFTLPFLAAVWVVPETPRWYLSKGRVSQARRSLRWLRSDKEPEDLHIRASPKRTSHHAKPVSIVMGLMFFQQFSGINAVIFYTTQIFQESGTSLDPSFCTAIIGLVNFGSTFVAAVLVDRLGRKVLMYASCLLMSSTLAILGLYFYLLKVESRDLKVVQWLPLSCFVVYVLGFSVGLGPVPWLMMGEVLPAAIRGSAASVAAAFNWGCTFAVTKTFPLFVDRVGAHYAFWFFAVMLLGAAGFLKMVVPETKKKTLEDIERILGVN